MAAAGISLVILAVALTTMHRLGGASTELEHEETKAKQQERIARRLTRPLRRGRDLLRRLRKPAGR